MARKLEQHQVPDGMAANVPWGYPLDQWSDRMVERGVRYLAGGSDKPKLPDGEGAEFFPHLFVSLQLEAADRGIDLTS